MKKFQSIKGTHDLLPEDFKIWGKVKSQIRYFMQQYGYSEIPFGDESAYLENIANQSNNPLYSYGTDEDAYGLSSRGIDPLCSTWDMSNDPIAYYDNQLDLVDKLWEEILINFEKYSGLQVL